MNYREAAKRIIKRTESSVTYDQTVTIVADSLKSLLGDIEYAASCAWTARTAREKTCKNGWQMKYQCFDEFWRVYNGKGKYKRGK